MYGWSNVFVFVMSCFFCFVVVILKIQPITLYQNSICDKKKHAPQYVLLMLILNTIIINIINPFLVWNTTFVNSKIQNSHCGSFVATMLMCSYYVRPKRFIYIYWYTFVNIILKMQFPSHVYQSNNLQIIYKFDSCWCYII